MYISETSLFQSFINVQVRDIEYTPNIVYSSQLAISRTFSSSQAVTAPKRKMGYLDMAEEPRFQEPMSMQEAAESRGQHRWGLSADVACPTSRASFGLCFLPQWPCGRTVDALCLMAWASMYAL